MHSADCRSAGSREARRRTAPAAATPRRWLRVREGGREYGDHREKQAWVRVKRTKSSGKDIHHLGVFVAAAKVERIDLLCEDIHPESTVVQLL